MQCKIVLHSCIGEFLYFCVLLSNFTVKIVIDCKIKDTIMSLCRELMPECFH